jgi:threonine dehydratase
MAAQPPSTSGVIATSSGNFGQGLARAASRRGAAATIVCPADANPLKVAAMRRLGATVHLADPGEGDGKDVARRMANDQGLLFVEDGAHWEIAAGAGGIAQELTEAGVRPSVLLVQIGDGALAIGVGSWLRARSPETRVIGVVAAGAPALALSLEAGHPVEAAVDTIADGMAIHEPVTGIVELLARCVDEVLVVDDRAIRAAMRLLEDAAGVLTEPSGAAGVAAVMTNRERFAGIDVATIVTGSNVNPALRDVEPPA